MVSRALCREMLTQRRDYVQKISVIQSYSPLTHKLSRFAPLIDGGTRRIPLVSRDLVKLLLVCFPRPRHFPQPEGTRHVKIRLLRFWPDPAYPVIVGFAVGGGVGAVELGAEEAETQFGSLLRRLAE